MTSKLKTERFVWLDIMLTLLTLELMAYFYYGARAVFLSCVCVAVSVAAEIVSLRFMGKSFTADDLTCTSDALILSLMLPAVVDYRIAGIGCLFGVIAAKNIFGGRANMIFSPAAAAYLFMITSWKNQVLQFTEPHVHTGITERASGLVSSASHNFNLTGKLGYTDFELLMGNFPGPAGAVSLLLLIVAALILLFRRDISAGAFIGNIAGTVFMAKLVPAAADPSQSVKYTLAMNMVLFASIYIVSDRRIAPKRDYFAFFYGLFIAVTSYLLVVTGAKENAVVLVTVLFTPISLGLKNLEKRIDLAIAEQEKQAEEVEVTEEQQDDALVQAQLLLSGEEAQDDE